MWFISKFTRIIVRKAIFMGINLRIIGGFKKESLERIIGKYKA